MSSEDIKVDEAPAEDKTFDDLELGKLDDLYVVADDGHVYQIPSGVWRLPGRRARAESAKMVWDHFVARGVPVANLTLSGTHGKLSTCTCTVLNLASFNGRLPPNPYEQIPGPGGEEPEKK